MLHTILYNVWMIHLSFAVAGFFMVCFYIYIVRFIVIIYTVSALIDCVTGASSSSLQLLTWLTGLVVYSWSGLSDSVTHVSSVAWLLLIGSEEMNDSNWGCVTVSWRWEEEEPVSREKMCIKQGFYLYQESLYVNLWDLLQSLPDWCKHLQTKQIIFNYNEKSYYLAELIQLACQINAYKSTVNH